VAHEQVDRDTLESSTQTSTFLGLALESEECCRGHNLKPMQCIAIEGMNTGHKLYMCLV
jgi:hypothetical protein